MSASVPPPPPAGPPPPSGPPPSGWSPGAAPSPIPAGSYPVGFTFNSPGKIARWRPLVHWLLVIPHIIVLYLLSIVASVLAFVAWFTGVFAGKVPEGLQGLIIASLRYSARVQTYIFFMREEYPPFNWDLDFTDPGTDPRTRFDVVPAIEGRSRLTIFFRGLLVIPHFIVAFFLFIAVYVVYIIGWFAVIILGRWPAGLESFLVGFIRWSSRLNAYYYLLTDEFPPFGFE
ncbi:MAG: DUF4389 domain-containing protein [Aeromicrobium sp.]